MEQETKFIKSVTVVLLIVLVALSGVYFYEEVANKQEPGADSAELTIGDCPYRTVEVSYDPLTLDAVAINRVGGTVMYNKDSVTEHYSRAIVLTAIRRQFNTKKSREITDKVYNEMLEEISVHVSRVDSNVIFYPEYRNGYHPMPKLQE
jgi:hypothetical protein